MRLCVDFFVSFVCFVVCFDCVYFFVCVISVLIVWIFEWVGVCVFVRSISLFDCVCVCLLVSVCAWVCIH